MTTMVQAGLFENMVATGKSQSKQAKYHRAYRSNPENRNRINSQKKRRRALSKEREMGNVSSMFESAAHPAKSEQQNVENLGESYDSDTLAKCGSEASGFTQAELLKQFAEMRKETENRDKQRDERQRYLEDTVAKILNFPGSQELIRQSEQRILDAQMKLIMELRAEVKEFKKSLEPAAQVLPKVNQLEQQTVAGDIAAPNAENLPKKKTILKRFMEKLPVLGASLFLLAFLGLNTFFLVSEQVSLYKSMSYSAGMAMMIAVLSEASLILLSSMASWTSSFEWKAWLTMAMFVVVAVMVGILDSSAKNRSGTAARQTQEAKNIEKQMQTLRALEAPILARIESLDPKVYPSKISELSAQLTASPNGYSFKIEQLSAKLATISTTEADTSMLAWQRRAALFLNLLFSGFLGYLWSSKDNESLLKIVSRSIRSYLQKTCDA